MRIFKRRPRAARPATFDAEFRELLDWGDRRVDRPTISYGGYLPTCPRCRNPLSKKDIRRLIIGSALADEPKPETLGA
ncbi:MAG: hypothetical protein ACM4D3_18315 [Candidatus Sericytochromatia bacterium]